MQNIGAVNEVPLLPRRQASRLDSFLQLLPLSSGNFILVNGEHIGSHAENEILTEKAHHD
jgi:hypothetical protein